MKVKRIFCENFCTLKQAEISFEGSNIVYISGLNSAGKSTLCLILPILGGNYKKTLQAHLIRYGEKYYKIGFESDEGVIITQTRRIKGKGRSTKQKTPETEVIWEASKDGVVLYTNLVNDKVLPVDGVPNDSVFSIKNYMNFVIDKDTNIWLNYRNRLSGALFINSGGGDNYKLLTNVLNYDLVAETQKILNETLNGFMRNFTATSDRNFLLKDMLSSMLNVPQDLLNEYKENLTQIQQGVTRAETLNQLTALNEQIEQMVIPPDADSLDTVMLNKFMDIGLLRKRLKDWQDIYLLVKSQKDADVLPYEDIERLSDIQDLMATKESYEQAKRVAENLVEAEMVPVPMLDSLMDLKDLRLKLKDWQGAYLKDKELEKELQSFEALKQQVLGVCKALGMSYCKNCGYVTEANHKH